jgi:hypothetical protein
MSSSTGRTITGLFGGIVIVIVSFVVTTMALNYWAAPQKTIQIMEATYGNNCKDFQASPGQENLVKPGNAMADLVKACQNAVGHCTYLIDQNFLGDPAPGCAKDFMFTYRCGSEAAVHRVTTPAEAANKTASMFCPAHQ